MAKEPAAHAGAERLLARVHEVEARAEALMLAVRDRTNRVAPPVVAATCRTFASIARLSAAVAAFERDSQRVVQRLEDTADSAELAATLWEI
jgi:hypothetical protein